VPNTVWITPNLNSFFALLKVCTLVFSIVTEVENWRY